MPWIVPTPQNICEERTLQQTFSLVLTTLLLDKLESYHFKHQIIGIPGTKTWFRIFLNYRKWEFDLQVQVCALEVTRQNNCKLLIK